MVVEMTLDESKAFVAKLREVEKEVIAASKWLQKTEHIHLEVVRQKQKPNPDWLTDCRDIPPPTYKQLFIKIHT